MELQRRERIQIMLRQPQQRTISRLVIFSDSQASLQSLARPKMPSGQLYLESCLSHLQWLAAEGGIQTELRWIPAHCGIPDAERVDELAKEAAVQPANWYNPFNRYTLLAAAFKTGIRRTTRMYWAHEWVTRQRATAKQAKRLIVKPGKKTLRYWQGLRKATALVLIQLRTGKIGLGAYLKKINRRDSGRCSCDEGNQTVKHVLLECSLLADLRHNIRTVLSRKNVQMTTLDSLLKSELARTEVAQFMMNTGLLGQFLAVDSAATGMEGGREGDEEISAHQGNGEEESNNIAPTGSQFRSTATPLHPTNAHDHGLGRSGGERLD